MSNFKFFGDLAFYGTLGAILLAVPFGETGAGWQKSLFVVTAVFFAAMRVAAPLQVGAFRFAQPSLLLLPLAGVILLALIQIVSLPGLGGPISQDPYATKEFIVIFAAIAVAVETLLFCTNTPGRLARLVIFVIVIGIGSAGYGILRDALGPPAGANQGFAQFTNRNHFGVLAEMTLGLLIGLVLKGGGGKRVRIGAVLGAALIIDAVIRSNSRGALVSVAAMAVFAAAAYVFTRSTNRRSRLFKAAVAIALSALIIVIAALMVTVVGGEDLVARFENIDVEIETLAPTEINRAAIWRSTVELIESRPLFGAGFGAFGTVVTRFDATSGKFNLQQAHNEYLEILANGGVAAFALFVWLVVLIIRRMLHNLRAPDRARQTACFGAAIGMFGVAVHSLVDFGLHVLINALVFAILAVIAAADVPHLGHRVAGRTKTN